VTNEDGLTLYSQEFQEAFINVEDDLVGGALNALSSLFMEILDQKQRFNHIKMENRVILFQTIKKGSVVLIVRRSSFLLQHTLYAFTSAIIDKYGTILENWGGDLSVFDGLEGLIEKYFPFVNIK
jgi:DNA-directed RNA polymerase subunit H (RpoH/RPB5)